MRQPAADLLPVVVGRPVPFDSCAGPSRSHQSCPSPGRLSSELRTFRPRPERCPPRTPFLAIESQPACLRGRVVGVYLDAELLFHQVPPLAEQRVRTVVPDAKKVRRPAGVEEITEEMLDIGAVRESDMGPYEVQLVDNLFLWQKGVHVVLARDPAWSDDSLVPEGANGQTGGPGRARPPAVSRRRARAPRRKLQPLRAMEGRPSLTPRIEKQARGSPKPGQHNPPFGLRSSDASAGGTTIRNLPRGVAAMSST
jgi:hypothetical protein